MQHRVDGRLCIYHRGNLVAYDNEDAYRQLWCPWIVEGTALTAYRTSPPIPPDTTPHLPCWQSLAPARGLAAAAAAANQSHDVLPARPPRFGVDHLRSV